MVWEEIKRILSGADEEVKGEAERAARAADRDEEISGELTEVEPRRARTLPGGVTVEPLPVSQGEAFTVSYEGILAQQGAAGITLHAGYGRGRWEHIQDIPMHPVGYQRWQATVFSDRSGPFSFCFRDTANHWDNNGGQNWTIDIQPS